MSDDSGSKERAMLPARSVRHHCLGDNRAFLAERGR